MSRSCFSYYDVTYPLYSYPEVMGDMIAPSGSPRSPNLPSHRSTFVPRVFSLSIYCKTYTDSRYIVGGMTRLNVASWIDSPLGGFLLQRKRRGRCWGLTDSFSVGVGVKAA